MKHLLLLPLLVAIGCGAKPAELPKPDEQPPASPNAKSVQVPKEWFRDFCARDATPGVWYWIHEAALIIDKNRRPFLCAKTRIYTNRKPRFVENRWGREFTQHPVGVCLGDEGWKIKLLTDDPGNIIPVGYGLVRTDRDREIPADCIPVVAIEFEKDEFAKER